MNELHVIMTKVRQPFLAAFKLILLTFFLYTTSAVAQDKSVFSLEKERYRVIAVKNDTNQIESVSNIAELTRPTTIYLPNAFTPDQDDNNDRFGAVGINVEKYELRIFNRWGELIFESNRIENKWDGRHQGQPVPDGVYVYTLVAKELVSGKNITKTGTVTLLL